MFITEQDTGAEVQVAFYRHQPQYLALVPWKGEVYRFPVVRVILALLAMATALYLRAH